MEIIGRLTRDANVQIIKKDNKKVVNFSVAINDSYKPKNSSEVKKIVEYVQCAYWKNDTIAPYLTKGTLVELSGRIGLSVYKDMQGEAKGTLTFHTSTIKLHGKANAESTNQKQTTSANQVTEPSDDLPF
jgi:single-strand DNA-binding protein